MSRVRVGMWRVIRLGWKGGVSTYGYAVGNPLQRVDPTGRAAVLLLPLCAGGACQAFLAQCAYAAGGLLIAAGIYNAADEVQQCPNDNACSNDDDDDDEVDCEEWLALLKAMRITIVAKQISNPGADFSILVAQYKAARVAFCKNCPSLCSQVPSL